LEENFPGVIPHGNFLWTLSTWCRQNTNREEGKYRGRKKKKSVPDVETAANFEENNERVGGGGGEGETNNSRR